MLKKTLGITLTMLLLTPLSTAFADSSVTQNTNNLITTAVNSSSTSSNDSTPDGLSISDVWSKITTNSKNSTTQEAFKRSIPKSSEYLTSCEDNDGNLHNYYLLKLEDKYKATSSNYLTALDTYLIYRDDFVTSKQYHNGYYGTWFPENSLSFQDGVMSANLGFKKYSWGNFNDYKRLHIFDFNTLKDYTVEYFDGVQTSHPYFVCYNMVNKNQIVYGRACWYRDGSGSSFLSRIDRETGKTITNKDIVFESNSEVNKGKMVDDTNYQFFTSKNGGYLYTINVNTLEVVSKVAGTYSNGTFVPKNN